MPFTSSAQPVSMFCFGVVFNCFKISQAVFANAFTSEYFSTSKGNFYKLEFMKNKLQVEGTVVLVMNSISEIASFWKAEITFSSLLDF